MAKTAWINRNERKRATAKKYAALRAELKAKKDYAGLTQLPRDASPTRVVNRCEVSGRRRAFIRRFKMSRLTFRELASQGLIPGVTKSAGIWMHTFRRRNLVSRLRDWRWAGSASNRWHRSSGRPSLSSTSTRRR